MPLTRPLTALTGLLLLAALLLLPADPAAAHARLVDSTPAAGVTIDQVPTTITLEFSEPVEADFGQLQVSGPDGERLDQAPPTADGSTVTSEIAAATTAGTHTVAFRIISADGHPVEQEFTYEVSEAAITAAQPAPVEEATTQPAAGATDAEAAPEEAATEEAATEEAAVELDTDEPAAVDDGGLPILPIAVGALVVLGLGGAFLARRGTAVDPTPEA